MLIKSAYIPRVDMDAFQWSGTFGCDFTHCSATSIVRLPVTHPHAEPTPDYDGQNWPWPGEATNILRKSPRRWYMSQREQFCKLHHPVTITAEIDGVEVAMVDSSASRRHNHAERKRLLAEKAERTAKRREAARARMRRLRTEEKGK
jgi:hypothetical protein